MKRIRRYHANSRTYLITNSHVSGKKSGELSLFDGMIRDMFVEKLRDYAVFCGVDVYSFAVLRDHFQLLVHVRRREVLSDEDLLSRLSAIYHPLTVDEVREDLAKARAVGDHGAAEAIRSPYLRRMWDLSNFMKELLAWISQWVNREKGRTGTLFEDRFRSVVVEKDHAVIEMLAAYVEMAAVREGLVDRPEAWKWSAGGAARLGSRFAQAAVRRTLKIADKTVVALKTAYTSWIDRLTSQIPGRPMNRPEEKQLDEPRSFSEMLFCKVQYFTHGKAIGGWSFYSKLKTDEGEPVDWAEWIPMEGADFRRFYAASTIPYPVSEMVVSEA